MSPPGAATRRFGPTCSRAARLPRPPPASATPRRRWPRWCATSGPAGERLRRADRAREESPQKGTDDNSDRAL